MTAQSATAFDRLATLAGATRTDRFSAHKDVDGWHVFCGGAMGDGETLDDAVDEAAKRFIDSLWRQRHDSHAAVVTIDLQLKTLRRIGLT